MAESMNSWHWVSTALNRNEKVSPISAYLKLKIFMDIDGFLKKLRGCLHDILFCYAKGFVMRLLHVLLYLAATDIAVLEEAKI